MQHAEPVQLRQVRDFGQVLGTTFLFLRQNLRMMRMVAFIAAPFLVIGSLLSNFLPVYMMRNASLQDFAEAGPFGALGYGDSWMFAVPGFVISVIGMVLLTASMHEYLRAYHLGEHHMITTGDLFARSWSQFGPYLGSSILVWLLSVVALILCLIPAVFVCPLLMLTFAAHAIERRGGAGSLGRSNELVKGDYWAMVGLFLVIWIIWYICNVVLQLPFIIVGIVIGVSTGLSMIDDPAFGDGSTFMEWMVWFQAAAALFQSLTYCLTFPVIAVCFCLKYFSRVEEVEGHGLREKIAGFDQV